MAWQICFLLPTCISQNFIREAELLGNYICVYFIYRKYIWGFDHIFGVSTLCNWGMLVAPQTACV